MEINKLNEINNKPSSTTHEQKEKPSDAQERESAGDEKLRKASLAAGSSFIAGINITSKSKNLDSVSLSKPSQECKDLCKYDNGEMNYHAAELMDSIMKLEFDELSDSNKNYMFKTIIKACKSDDGSFDNGLVSIAKELIESRPADKSWSKIDQGGLEISMFLNLLRSASYNERIKLKDATKKLISDKSFDEQYLTTICPSFWSPNKTFNQEIFDTISKQLEEHSTKKVATAVKDAYVYVEDGNGNSKYYFDDLLFKYNLSDKSRPNDFAIDCIKGCLSFGEDERNQILSSCKNKEGYIDISMLHIIRNADKENHSYYMGDEPNLAILEVAKKLNIYDELGIQVSSDITNIIKKTPIISELINEEDSGISYDISKYFVKDGKINVKEMSDTSDEINSMILQLKKVTSMPADNRNPYFNKSRNVIISKLYDLSKENPEQYKQIMDALSKIHSWRPLEEAFSKDGSFNIEKLLSYSELPDDVRSIALSSPTIKKYLDGKTIAEVGNFHEELTSEEKEILKKYDVDIDYMEESFANKDKKSLHVTETQQSDFEKTIDNCDKILANADLTKGIELEYTREEFDKDIVEITKDMPVNKAQELLNFYGLTLKDGKTEGVFITPENSVPESLKDKSKEIETTINKFKNSKPVTDNSELNDFYTKIVNNFPEFKMLVGKTDNHGKRVDTEVLQQMQRLVNNPEYKILSNSDKKLAKLAIMFRAMTYLDTKGEIVTKDLMFDSDGLTIHKEQRRAKNGKYTEDMLKRFNLTREEKIKILSLVSHSGWSYNYSPDQVAVNNRLGTLNLSKIIEDTINPDNNIDMQSILHEQQEIYQNTQIINTATAKDLEPYWEKQTYHGVEIEVLDLTKKQLPDNIYLLAHFVQGDLEDTINLSENLDENVFLSFSLIKPNSVKSMGNRTMGIVAEFDNRNVAQAATQNIDSKFGKDYTDFSDYIKKDTNKYVKNIVKKILNLSDVEYGLLMEQIGGTSLYDIEENYYINGKVITKQTIIDAHNVAYNEMVDATSHEHNEVTVDSPVPFAFVSKIGIPSEIEASKCKKVILLPNK